VKLNLQIVAWRKWFIFGSFGRLVDFSSKGLAFRRINLSPLVYLTYRLAIQAAQVLEGPHGHYSYHLSESAANSPAVTASFYDESIEAYFGREGLRKRLPNCLKHNARRCGFTSSKDMG